MSNKAIVDACSRADATLLNAVSVTVNFWAPVPSLHCVFAVCDAVPVVINAVAHVGFTRFGIWDGVIAMG